MESWSSPRAGLSHPGHERERLSPVAIASRLVFGALASAQSRHIMIDVHATNRARPRTTALADPACGKVAVHLLHEGASLVAMRSSHPLLVICVKGLASIRYSGGLMHERRRSWQLLPPTQGHLSVSQDSGLSIVSTIDPSDAFVRFIELESGSTRGRLSRPVLSRINAIKRIDLGADSQDSASSLFHLHAALEALFATSCARSAIDKCPGRTLSRKIQFLHRISKARLHIESNPGRAVQSEELAQVSCFSPWHFSRMFRRVYDCGPQEYGINWRLQYACHLIRESNLPICDIANACGFETSSAFGRAFLARYRTPPSRLRRNHRHACSRGGNG